jgi:hypothetical protein
LSAVVTVTVSNTDTTPPTVAISAPAAGATVSGTVPLTAEATDNVGVSSVQFRIDGADFGAPDTAAPFTIAWPTTGSTNGPHQLTALARDAAGNQTLSAVVTVTVSNTTASALVAAYGFNEGTGSTTTDGSGNGHAGTITGATWTTSGKFGAALSFDGAGDWVTVADAPALDLTTSMTLEAWVFPTAASGWRTVVIKEAPGGQAYGLYSYDNAPRPAVYLNTGQPVDVWANGTTNLPLNTWSHLAATYDGVTLRLFVNGVQAGTKAVTGPIVVTTGVLRIGGNSIWGEFFTGRIDEIRLYNRVLTATEIQTDMITPVAGS